MFGVVPEVIPVPAPDIPIPLLQTPSQKKTDFQYLNIWRRRSGYVFYLVPGPLPGTSQAYWGPQMRLGMPQTALNVNMDTWTNVESLNFRYEPQNAVLPIVFIQDPITKVPIPIPIPPVTPFSPPLGLAVMPPQKIEFMIGHGQAESGDGIDAGFCARHRDLAMWSRATDRWTSCATGSPCARAAWWGCAARDSHLTECTMSTRRRTASSPGSTSRALC